MFGSKRIDQAAARAWTGIAQAVAAVGVLAVLAVGVLGSWSSVPRSAPASGTSAQGPSIVGEPAAPKPEAQEPGVDLEVLAGALSKIGNAPSLAAAPSPSQPIGEESSHAQGGTARYIGSVRMGGAWIPIISVNGTQRVVMPGQKLSLAEGAYTVREVTPEGVTLEGENGAAKTLAREARTVGAVTVIAPAGAAAPQQPAAEQNPTARVPAQPSEEGQSRAERWRERMQRMRQRIESGEIRPEEIDERMRRMMRGGPGGEE